MDRVVKVSHSTRTAILQLVDPACAAAQTLRPEFGIFIFCQFFCQMAVRACLGSCNRWRKQRNPYFSFGYSFDEKDIRAQLG